MAASKQDATSALVAVVKALEPLSDGDKQWVLQSAASRWTLNVQLSGPSDQTRSKVGGTGEASRTRSNMNGGDVQAAITDKDVRSFMRIKKPTTDVQRVTCLGHYLVKTTRKPGFSSKEIKEAHTESGGSAMNIARALDNATRGSKYLSNRGPREKQLTPLGEDVVEALPDPEAVAAAEKAAKATRKGRKGKSKKAKKN